MHATLAFDDRPVRGPPSIAGFRDKHSAPSVENNALHKLIVNFANQVVAVGATFSWQLEGGSPIVRTSLGICEESDQILGLYRQQSNNDAPERNVEPLWGLTVFRGKQHRLLTLSFDLPGGRALLNAMIADGDGKCRGRTSARLAMIQPMFEVMTALRDALDGWRVPDGWAATNRDAVATWNTAADGALAAGEGLPTDAQVIGAVARKSAADATIVCAAGGLPGELHKLWRVRMPGTYHAEYGYSCMGYEIAAGLGVKMADPARDVIVMVGDGSYMMLNSELATSVMLGLKIVVVLLDNRGFGCIDRLQRRTGGRGFNNLLADSRHDTLPAIDFAAHARSMGAQAEKVGSLDALEQALERAAAADRSYVIVIDTDPASSTEAGGHWWDVAVPAVSTRGDVRAARADYEAILSGEGQ